MLLEVVIAVGVLVLGMAFVGLQIFNSSRQEMESERALRGLLLAESKLAELDTGLIQYDEEIEEEFGPLYPDFGWRMQVDQTSIPELNMITLQILHRPRMNVDEEFQFDEAVVVHTLYTMRATPTRLDLTRDFGLEEEKADELTEQLSGIGDGGLDPRDLNPAIFKDLDLEQLMEVAPALLEAFGMSMSDIKRLLPPELQQALEDAQADLEDSKGEDAPDGSAGGAGGDQSGSEAQGASPGGEAVPAGEEGGIKDPGRGGSPGGDEVSPSRGDTQPPRKPERRRPPIRGNRGGNRGAGSSASPS